MHSTLEKLFHLKENQTNSLTELIAALTTFLTMSYIIFVNPLILHSAGINFNAAFVATCITAAMGTALVGYLTNYPVAVAPSMGMNAYFTYIIVQSLGFSWESALATAFLAATAFFFISLSRARTWIVNAIPINLGIALSAGIGLFIVIIALKGSGIIMVSQKAFLTLGPIISPKVLLFFLGFFLIIILEHYRVRGAIIISIASITLLGILSKLTPYNGFFSLPPSIKPSFFALDFTHILNYNGLIIIFTFLMVSIFDTTGTLIGLFRTSDLSAKKELAESKRISKALIGVSFASFTGALLGTSSTSVFIESAAGIREGGRTGLTAIIISLLFLAALFFSPLASSIPNFAVNPVLLYIGLLMLRNITHINFEDFTEFFPSIITVIMIPLTFSIADGLGLGLLSYLLIKLLSGKTKEINLFLASLGLIFIIYFILHPQL